MKAKTEFPIYEFRPDKLLTGKLLRYAEGRWIEDDGEYDIAFVSTEKPYHAFVYLPHRKNLRWSWVKNGRWGAYVGGHPDGNAWHYMLKDGETDFRADWDRDKHINEIVSNLSSSKCCAMFSCANGFRVEFNVLDETINAGLLRIKETKEIVTPPPIFKCIYCGPIDWKKHEVKTEINKL